MRREGHAVRVLEMREA